MPPLCSCAAVICPAPAPRPFSGDSSMPVDNQVDLWLQRTHGLQIESRHQQPWRSRRSSSGFAEDWDPRHLQKLTRCSRQPQSKSAVSIHQPTQPPGRPRSTSTTATYRFTLTATTTLGPEQPKKARWVNAQQAAGRLLKVAARQGEQTEPAIGKVKGSRNRSPGRGRSAIESCR